MIAQFRRISTDGGWKAMAGTLLATHPAGETVKDFCTVWIESGHRLREQVDDDRYLVKLLRHMLPVYQGEAVELFRGENCQRWREGKVGLAWTTEFEVAHMFAAGLNAVHSGGIVLKALAMPQAIICGPIAHSNWLGEEQFTVDPAFLTDVSVVEHFPNERI